MKVAIVRHEARHFKGKAANTQVGAAGLWVQAPEMQSGSFAAAVRSAFGGADDRTSCYDRA